MIDGIEVAVDHEAVVVTKNLREDQADDLLQRVAAERGIPGPWVGLLTSARTEKAEVTEASEGGLSALAAVTVGLSNRVAAGASPIAVWARSTINAIVVVDGAPEPAALVNVVMTVTEVKTALLAAAEVRCDDGHVASGTSTAAVVVAATWRGMRQRFGGPISELGWVVARATRTALGAGIRRWMDEHR